MQCNKASISTWCILLDFFFLQQRKTTQINLKRCDIYSKIAKLKKKCVGLYKMAGCDRRSLIKIRANFVPIPGEAGMRQHNFT